MLEPSPANLVRIPPDTTFTHPLALGCWAFGGNAWGGQDDADSLAALTAAFDGGLNHFDTATAYGNGRSESLVGDFLSHDNRRDDAFLASKFNIKDTLANAEQAVDESLQRLQTDTIDLYYIHWPKSDTDLRPWMQSLETCRAKGKIKCIGVSNFSVAQMEQVSQVGRIDAAQFCYNLFWRHPEHDVIPYCRRHDIAIATYSSIAQGILTGKFGPSPSFPEGDNRSKGVLFEEDVYPQLYCTVEKMKPIAEESGQPLTHLAIQWVANQPGITSVIVGSRNADQARRNAQAMEEPVTDDILNKLTALSDAATPHIPNTGNIFRHYP